MTIDIAIFEQMRPRLTAISCRIVGSEAEAEDIVQDCFLKWREVEQAALATPATWLTTGAALLHRPPAQTRARHHRRQRRDGQHLARARRRLREAANDADTGEKINRELVRRFQAAINGVDVAAMVTLLSEEQPMSVQAHACANDAIYALAA
jgi:DNA-directed RNA polymerase specialized sigma24 family protein